MDRLGSFIVGNRLPIAAVSLVFVLFLAWRVSLLKEDLSFETLYLSSDDQNIAFSEAFAKKFDNVNDMVAIAITGGDLFGPDCLEAVRRITRRIEKIQEVDVVYSLSNIRYIQAKDDVLDVSEFLQEIPRTAEQVQDLESKAGNYDLFRGRLVSADGKYIAIVVQTADIIGQPIDTHIAGLFSQLSDDNLQIRASAVQSIKDLQARVMQVIRTDEARIPALVKTLIQGEDESRQQAMKELAAIGPSSVRIQTVADRRHLIEHIENIIEEELPPGFTQYVTGTNVIERDYSEILRHDQTVFHILTIIILTTGFFLTFLSVRDTIIAFSTLLIAATCALGLVQLLGGVIDIINSVVSIMVLVVGTSDVIHMMYGFYHGWRPEDGDQAGQKAAVRMVGSVGFTCLMSSLTTACGFFSLYSARIGTISRFGLNMAVAILATYVITLIAMTIMLSMLKQRPQWRTAPHKQSRLTQMLQGLALFVVQRRWQAALICLLVFSSFSYGYKLLYVETHAVAEVPEDSPTKINIKAMDNLAGYIGFEVSIKSADKELIEPDTLAKVEEIVQYLREQPETLRTWSVVDYIKTMNQAAYQGKQEFYSLPDSAAAVDQFLLLYTFSREGLREIGGLISEDRKWLRIVSRVHDVGAGSYLALKDRVEQRGRALFVDDDIDVRVTSEMTLLHAAMDNIVKDLARSITYAFVLVAILMAFSLRSLRLGLVAILPNVLPVLMTLGFMGLTGMELRVGTIVVFSLGFGIAVDDTIHYLLCYRRERARASSYEEAILRSHLRIGKPLVITSLVLIAGFLGAAPSTFKSLAQMGILNSFTMATALMADLLVLPLLLRFIERPAALQHKPAATPMEIYQAESAPEAEIQLIHEERHERK